MIFIVDILPVYNFPFSPECTYIFNIKLRMCFLELLEWDPSVGDINWVKQCHFPKHHEYLPAFARELCCPSICSYILCSGWCYCITVIRRCSVVFLIKLIYVSSEDILSCFPYFRRIG